ncbi:MAG: hypothetical protein R2705_09280 [Ilumatobacteraceae bacterium]
MIASATLAAIGDEAASAAYLPGLADGSRTGAVALDADVTITDGAASGNAGVVLGGALAGVVLVAVGDDVAIVETSADGVTVETPPNLDPSRRSARISLDGAPATVLGGAATTMRDLARVILRRRGGHRRRVHRGGRRLRQGA